MPNVSAQALYSACLTGDAAAVSRLLLCCSRLNLSEPRFQHPDSKSTPLMAAAACGHTEIVRMVLERAPTTTVDHADTALRMAAQYHHFVILGLLADRGANPRFANKRRETPLSAAIVKIHPDEPPRGPDPDNSLQLATVRVLLRLGASPNAIDGGGMTPLCVACHLGNTKVALALLAGGAKIDFTTLPRHIYAGFTPLMHAALASHAGVAKSLVKRGADGTKTATRGIGAAACTALDIARLRADHGPAFAETFAVLRRRCCSTCGMTSPGLATKTAGEQRHLKRCGECPARGCRARYCDEVCQRADWVLRHRGECAEARRVRQAAGPEV